MYRIVLHFCTICLNYMCAAPLKMHSSKYIGLQHYTVSSRTGRFCIMLCEQGQAFFLLLLLLINVLCAFEARDFTLLVWLNSAQQKFEGYLQTLTAIQ